MKRKYVSENALEHLSLHDCIIENVKIENNTLIFEFGHVDVLASHPYNSYDVAKCAHNSLFHFIDFTVLKSEFYDTSSVKKRIIHMEDTTTKTVEIEKLAIDFEVLELKETVEENGYRICKLYGMCSREFGNDTGEIIVKFKRILIGWDQLDKDAWFVGFGKNNDN